MPAPYQFGSGSVFFTPNSGDLAANPTPILVGTLQDVSVDFSFEVKKLYGRNQFPDDVARGKVSITFKAKFGRFNAKLINDLVFSQTLATGQKKTALDEVKTIAAGSSTVNNSAQFSEDLGVRYAATGAPLVKVASAPAIGQYSNSGTGVYTFNVGDNGTNNVLISYTYTTTGGFKTTGTNQLMGFGAKFALNFTQPYNTNQNNLKLFACTLNKLTRPSKNDDYTILELDGEAFADTAGNVFEFHDPE